MADELSQFIGLPADILSAIGKLREASAELGSQIRDTQRAIKEGEAAGRDVGELRERLTRMKDQKADVRAKIKADIENKKLDREGGIFGRIARLRTGAHIAGRIASGGVNIGDVGMAGSLAQRAGGALIQSGRVGLGGALARGGMEAARFASAAALPVGIMTAAAMSVGRLSRGEYQNHQIAAQGNAQVYGRLGDITRSSAQGGSKFSAGQMSAMLSSASAAGFRATEAVRKSSPVEFISRALGFTQNQRASNLETKAQQTAIDLAIAKSRYGSRLQKKVDALNTIGNAEVRNFAMRKLAQSGVYQTISNIAFARHILGPAYVWLYGDEAYEEAKIERTAAAVSSMQAIDDMELKRWLSPKNDVARALENERRHHVRTVDSERWARFNAWGMQ